MKGHIGHVHVGCPGGRTLLSCPHRYVKEANFAQTILKRAAPVTYGRDSDVPGDLAMEINRGIVGITGRAGRAGKFVSGIQCIPVDAVHGVFNGCLFDTEAQNVFELNIAVPDPHLMQLISSVELVLNPHRLRPNSATEPHGLAIGRMQVISIQPGAVDSVDRSVAFTKT